MNSPSREAKEFLHRFLAVNKRLQAYTLALVPNSIDADEVFQQTCLALWEKWSEFDPDRDFLPWAFGVARIEAKRFQARRGREWASLGDEAALVLARSVERSGSQLEERLSALQICLKQLSQEHQSLLRIYYAGTKKLNELARERNMTPNALSLRLKRLRELLHECVDRILVASEPL